MSRELLLVELLLEVPLVLVLMVLTVLTVELLKLLLLVMLIEAELLVGLVGCATLTVLLRVITGVVLFAKGTLSVD